MSGKAGVAPRKIALALLVLIAAPIVGGIAMAEKPAKEKSKPVFAFVALNKITHPSADQVRTNLQAVLSKAQKIENVEIDEKGVSFSIDGQTVIYGCIDFPIPWKDLEYPCQVSWVWRDATKAMKNHRAHIMVMLQSDRGTHLERCILLTKLLSAAAATFDTAGVYWGHGSVVVSKDLIQKMAKDASASHPPLLVWINFYPQKSKEGLVSVVTEGLDYFDCKEIEIIDSKQPFKKVLGTAMGVAFITIKGEVIKDGDTVGGTANEKIKTKFAKSVRDGKQDVLRIEY